jgi:carbonic anhydrase/acetyltransferase-like protein (isoleucine patch superfamily)
MPAIRRLANGAPVLGKGVFVDASAVVSGQVFLGEDASVWPCTSIRGDLLPIEIGARSNIQDGSILHTSQKSSLYPQGFALSIGEDVTIGHGVILHGCTIANLCLIGMGSIVLDGVIIQSEVFLGAGSLVPPGKILESGFLWLGNPVKKIRPLSEAERQFFSISAQNYVKLKDLHLL